MVAARRGSSTGASLQTKQTAPLQQETQKKEGARARLMVPEPAAKRPRLDDVLGAGVPSSTPI